MTEGPVLRNHWSLVASNTVKSAVTMAFVLLVTLSVNDLLRPDVYLAALGAVSLAFLAVYIVIWKKTTYHFLQDEIVVRRATVFRSETRIQYDRLASVNVERDFICRILGATKLSFNLNSSVNVSAAEAYIVLSADEAEKLIRETDSRIFGRPASVESEALEEPESLVDVSLADIVLHSFFGMPTSQFGFGLLMLAYSVWSFVYGGSISILSTLLFVLDFFLPAVSSLFRLYGYRITRLGSSVSISSGFFSTRSDSFMLSKVNFVKVREPLLCRLMGRAILEVEVVGTANNKGVPLLCPLKPKGVAFGLLHDLLPEFECTGKEAGQLRVSLVGIGLVAIVVMAAAAAVLFAVSGEVPREHHAALYVAMAAVAAVCAVWASMAYRTRRFAFDENIALLVTGSCDRTSNYILMDKIQYADVRSTPVQRRAGAARCSLSLLSTAGASTVTSGVFPAEDLEAVSGIVMSRIRDGRYDFRRFQRRYARISAELERTASPNPGKHPILVSRRARTIRTRLFA